MKNYYDTITSFCKPKPGKKYRENKMCYYVIARAELDEILFYKSFYNEDKVMDYLEKLNPSPDEMITNYLIVGAEPVEGKPKSRVVWRIGMFTQMGLTLF